MSDEERLTKRDGKGRAYFDDDGSLIRGANGSFWQKKERNGHPLDAVAGTAGGG